MATQNVNQEAVVLTATRFHTKKYQLQRKNHFEVQFVMTEENDFTIDPDLRFMLVSFPLPKETTELIMFWNFSLIPEIEPTKALAFNFPVKLI